MKQATFNLQHRLHYSAQDQRDCPWIAELDRAIRSNPDCEQCVMTRRGWAYSETDSNLSGNAAELLVKITDGVRRFPQIYPWYGHVFHGLDEQGHGCWVSMLIRLQGSIACGEDDYATIQEYWAMVGEVCALMRPYQQQVGDIVSAHDDFEEAVAALIDKIQRFKRALREEQVVDWKEGADGRQEPVYGPPLNSTVCRKVFAPYHLRDGVDFEHEVEGVQS